MNYASTFFAPCTTRNGKPAWVRHGQRLDHTNWAAVVAWRQTQNDPGTGLWKPGTFRDNRRKKGHLESFWAAYAEYDGKGDHTPEVAQAMLQAAGLRGWVAPSRSHMLGKKGVVAPRWHVMAPLSRVHDAADFEEMQDRLNSALGGILDDVSSWRPTQCFRAGSPHPILVTDGRCLDEIPAGTPYPRPCAPDGVNLDEVLSNRPERRGNDDGIVAWFCGTHDLENMLEKHEYVQGAGDDWQSPYSTSGSDGVMIVGDPPRQRFVSLHASDRAAGVGRVAMDGGSVFGDAFDLYIHFEHGNDEASAIATAHKLRDASDARVQELLPAAPPSADVIAARSAADKAAQALLDGIRAERRTAGAEVIEPVDLFGRFAPPPLPRGLLPPVIEQFAVVQGEYMGADPAGLAMAALTVCAASLPDSAKLRVKPGEGWAESARLWSALIGTPSAKKSPIINEAARPLKRIDAEMARANAEAMAAYRSLSKEDRESTPPPAQPRLRLEDATVEAVGEVLKDSPDGLLILQDELSGWFGAMDKYSGGGKGAAKDRGFWLTAFNGGDHCITRVSRGNVYIPNLSVCLLGGIQPEAIRAVAATSVDDGLLQRMCPILLQPASVGCEVARDEGARVAYDALVQRLRGMRSAMPYTFDAGAQALRRELEIDHLKWMRGFERINGRLASHIGKYDGIFSRLCILFHCCEQDGHLITVDTAKRVAKFLHGFLMRHAIGFYADVLGLSSSQDEIADTAGFILAHELQEIDARVGKSRVRSLRKLEVADILRVLEQLEGFGWLIPIQGPRASSRKWQVNGVVHERFAARAAEEAERRRADGEMLREMFADI